MKINVIIMLLFVIVTNKSFCQINKSVDEVLSITAKDKNLVFDGKGVSKDGHEYYSFKYINSKVLSKTFYFENDSCVTIRENIPNEKLSATITELNAKYHSLGHNTWGDRATKIVYVLDFVTDSPIFSLLTYYIDFLMKTYKHE